MSNKMIELKKEKFHKGFYENSAESIRKQLTEIEYSCSKSKFGMQECSYNARMFISPICHVFAYALHQKFGYDILELKNKSGTTVHWCCTTNYNGKKLYIDVRGMTTDYSELLMEFQPNIGSSPIERKIIDLSEYEDEWEEEQVKFANEIISEYYIYYSIL